MGSTLSGYAMATNARARGEKGKVFDWDKAARLILEHKPMCAEAALQGDEGYTGGTIYRDGEPVLDSYTYLMSLWAIPAIYLDGNAVPCYVDLNTNPGCEWGSDTKWPESALAILRGEAQ